jgi:hypothetical protein
VYAALGIGLLVNSNPAVAQFSCRTFDDNQRIVLRGEIVQSLNLGGEGVKPRKYMAVVLQEPICFIKDSDTKITMLEASQCLIDGWDIRSQLLALWLPVMLGQSR